MLGTSIVGTTLLRVHSCFHVLGCLGWDERKRCQNCLYFRACCAVCYYCSLPGVLETNFIQRDSCFLEKLSILSLTFECHEPIPPPPPLSNKAGRMHSKAQMPVMWDRKHTFVQCRLEH